MIKPKQLWHTMLVLLLIIIIFSGTIIDMIVDYQWFGDLGYVDAFLVKVIAYLKIGLPLWAISAIAFAFYFLWVEKQYFKFVHILVDIKSHKKSASRKWFLIFSVLSSCILALMTTSILWFDLLKFQNATPFNIADPLFAKDVAFYVFHLPLYNKLLGIGLLYIVFLAISTVAIYLLLMSAKPPTELNLNDLQNVRTIGDIVGLTRKGLMQSVIIKLGVFGFFVCLLLIAYFWLARYNLVFSPRGVAYGASYTDIQVTLPSLYFQLGASIIGAVAFLFGLISRRYRFMLTGPVLIVSLIFIFGIGATIVQNFIVEPDEISKERPYLEYNIDFTRTAYALNQIEEIDYPVATNLTEETLNRNQSTINNIRINDYRPLKQTYNQIQGIRLYYSFNDIDVGRYMINGDYTQVLLSAREMNTEKLQVQTWQNRHIKFTHGYGVTLSPVNAVNADGLPTLLIKNIPPEFETELKITRPEIYFGETTTDYIIVNTSEKEFDYPKGSDNQETMYEGDSGISMGFWNRVLFSIYQRDLRILVSNIISDESRLILRRDISHRLETLAPFITFDSDPYIVIDDTTGRLFWIVDGYTMSGEYPYSQPYSNSGINYIRNSVKSVIDAYTGETQLYVFDESDPLLKTYQAVYPGLFKEKSTFPPSLLAHTRYPKTLLQIQGDIYRHYHVTNPSVFYNGEDIWDVATELYMDATQVQPVVPDYAMFKLPGQSEVEFLLTQPYTPKDKPNMTSLFIARSDGANYGKLFLMKFPKDRTVTGPAMLESKIDQDSVISPQLSLWDQKGSTVLRGNILIVPIEGNLLYIEPIYLQAQNQESLPEMKQVVAAYGDRVVMAQSLDRALAELFGSGYSRDPGEDGTSSGLSDSDLDKILQETILRFERTQTELESLKKALDELQKAIEGQSPESTPEETKPAGD